MREPLGCEQIASGVDAYVSGALPPGHADRFERHIRGCRRCRRSVEGVRWAIDHLGALPREPMPPAMKLRILRAFRARTPA